MTCHIYLEAAPFFELLIWYFKFRFSVRRRRRRRGENRENGSLLQMEELRGERRSARETSPLRCNGDARSSLLRSQPEHSSGTYLCKMIVAKENLRS